MIAYVIDTFIVSLPLFAGIAAWTTVLRQPPPPLEIPLSLGTWIVPVSAALVTLLLAFVYPVYFWGRRGATPGKRALGLAVVTIEGEVPIGYRRAVIRIMGYVINGLLLGTGFLLIAVSEDKRGLHDRLAETCVVKRA